MKRIFVIGTIVVVLGAIVITLASNKKTIESKNVVRDRSSKEVTVVLEAAKAHAVKEKFEIPATLTASAEALISTATSGRIIALSTPLGRQVTEGQILGRMDVRETELKLQAVEVEIQRLKKEVDRNKILVEGNATTSKAYQDSQFDLESKIIEADQLKKQIANGNIVAPISGIISKRAKEIGEYVGMGAEIGKVVNTASLKAQVFIPETKVFKLKEGQKAIVKTDVFPSETFIGTISFISPQGDANHNYQVELNIENKSKVQLKAGMFATILFEQPDEQRVLLISKSALINGMSDPLVYVAENNTAVERKIIIGREIGDNVEVLSGLRESDQVIVKGQLNLVNGSKITLANL